MLKMMLRYKGVILLYLIVSIFMIVAINDNKVINDKGDSIIVIND